MKIAEFGAQILRQQAERVKQAEIRSAELRKLINSMQELLLTQKAGVALAAPQIGVSQRIVVIGVRPTEHRPNVEKVDLVMINPKITESFGYRTQMWEGCLSAGKSGLFAKTPRYRKVQVEYLDEHGKHKQKTFAGLMAQIAQHEIDHLDGVLFIDRVKDTKTYMTKQQYIRMLKQQSK